MGILCLIDRAMPFIYYCAMDPIVECVSDLDSYGFRKFRSPADAILAFCGKLSHPNASEYIYTMLTYRDVLITSLMIFSLPRSGF